MRVLFVYTDVGISVGYSCGIGVLSAYLKENGHETRLIHVSDELEYPLDPDRILADVEAYDPGLIAFSAVTNQWYFVKQIAKFLRRKLDTPIIVGGHHANAVPEEVIKEKAIDYACKGEGEKPLLGLVNRLEAGLPTDSIANITCKRAAATGTSSAAAGCSTPAPVVALTVDRNGSRSTPAHNGPAPDAVEAAAAAAAAGAAALDGDGDAIAVAVAASKAKVDQTHSHDGASNGSAGSNGDDGVIDNKMGRWVQDLDELPFEDRDIFQYGEIVDSRLGWAEVIASRGCPYACTYCFNLPFFSRYKNDTSDSENPLKMKDFVRRRSVESTVEMLREVKQQYPNIKYFTFVDDVFAIYSRWLADLAPLYAKEIGIPFACTSQPLAFNAKIARLLKEMGCKVVKMGVEAGNPRIRNQVLNRNIPDSVLIHDFKLARDHGLKPQAFNMIGLPTETRDNMLETVRLNAQLRAYIVWVSTFMPYPGTVLYDFCVNNDLIDQSRWNDIRSYRGGSVLRETTFTNLELEKMRVLFKWHLNAALENECSADFQQNIDELDAMSEDDWMSGRVEEIWAERDPALDALWRKREVDHYISKKYVNMFWAKEYDYDIS